VTGEPPTASTNIIRTARKEHECCECASTIKSGDRYRVYSGIWDGEASTFKQCLRCAELFDELTQEYYPNEGPCFGCLLENVAEDADRNEDENRIRASIAAKRAAATVLREMGEGT